MQNSKAASESYVHMTEMIMPNDTNTLNNLLGGRLMHFMDIAGAICAQKHSNNIVVTASADNLSFKQPVALGNVITIEAKVTRSFNSSMEVHIIVHAEDIPAGKKTKTNEAFFTFVTVNKDLKPIKTLEVIPETDEEKKLYDSALRRRELRLVMAGKLDPKDAPELKSIFK